MTQYKKAVFTVDGLEGCEFEGYTNGSHWNGWACPFFTKEVAEQVCEAVIKNGEEINFPAQTSYSKETDTFHIWLDASDEEAEETCQGKDIEVNGETVHVYCIGGWSWCWDEEIIHDMTEYQKNLLYQLSQVMFHIAEECEDDSFHRTICDLDMFTGSIDELATVLLGKVRGE